MKRLCGILLALAGLFLYAPCAAQNTRVRGTVTDAQTGEPIPYAVVLFPGTTTGITTDDEGFYSLESRDTSSYIRAEMVSYEPQIRPVHVGGYNQIDFRLTPSHLEIESVVITPGDNPAHPILEGIIRNKKYNDSKEYDRYICRTYTKMELGLANIREFRSKKLQQNFGFIFEHLDTSSVTGQPYLPVMISETAADYYHSRTPSVAREVIRASQISGIEDNSVLAQFTGHLHADVNLYENFIDLFGVKFASPLSNSGRSFYKYFLVDSTNVEGRKTYKIRFHPKSVATPVLDGEVNIDSASYALRSARVKMAKGVNVNWIRHLAIEADNRLTADSLWFPQREKMTADFTLTKSDSSKMIAFLGSHEVTYSDVNPYTNWIGRVQEQDKAIVERSLELVGMAAFAGKTMDRMSDGECQRVMIARALAQDTPIILLDEPTSFLDLPNRYELCTLLRRLAHDHRKCILFSTHELDIALSLCDSIALIDPPVLRYLPTPDMACSGYIERLFSNSFVTFDTESGTIKVRK